MTEFTPAPLPKGVRHMARRQCYRNAAETALGGTAAPTWDYAEGWAVNAELGMWVPHAWNVDEQGRAMDRTWRSPGLRYVGEIVATERVAKAVGRTGHYGPFLPPSPSPSQAKEEEEDSGRHDIHQDHRHDCYQP